MACLTGHKCIVFSSNSMRLFRRFFADLLLLGGLLVIVLLMNCPKKPGKAVIGTRTRGLTCGDPAISQPFVQEKETHKLIPSLVLNIITVGVVICVELLRWFTNADQDCYPDPDLNPIPRLGSNLYTVLMILAHGFLLNQMMTNVIQVVVGEQRPYFLDICRLQDFDTLCAAGNTFVKPEQVICTGEASWRQLESAKRSFPSGEASFGFCFAVFLVFYLQSRFIWRGPCEMVKHATQIGILTLALYVSFINVGNDHHLKDALAGVFLGCVIGLSASILLNRRLSRVAKFVQADQTCRIELSELRNGASASSNVSASTGLGEP